MWALVATLRLRVRNEHAKPDQSAPRRVRLLSQEQGRDPRDRLYPLLVQSQSQARISGGAGRRILGGIGRQSRFVAATRVAKVLARGPIRGSL